MIPDPHAPDDGDTALRARAKMRHDWRGDRCGHNFEPTKCPHDGCGFRAALTERDALKEEVGRLAGELVREMSGKALLEAALAEWEILILMVPEGAEGPKDVGLYLQRLQAVAEAVKVKVATEQWQYIPPRTMNWRLPTIQEQVALNESVAGALLAAGMDWRTDAK